MATRKNTRPKAARLRLTATEAMLRATEAEAAGDIQAAYDAAQSAVDATKESIALQHPCTEREQGELDTILRGGARTESEVPLSEVFCGPSPAQARDRCQRALGWFDATVGRIDSQSRSGREGAAEREEVLLNSRLKEALAEVSLPPKGAKGRTAAAIAHLKAKHQDLLNAKTPDDPRPVQDRAKDSWFREIITASQRLRDDRLRTAAAEMPITDPD